MRRLLLALCAFLVVGLAWAGPPVAPSAPTYVPASQRAYLGACFGDSICADVGTDGLGDGAPCTGNACGWNQWANYGLFAQQYSNYRVSWPYDLNFGISGQTTTQYLTRMGPMLASKANIVLVQGGANDIGAGATCATITSNFASIYNQIKAAGKIVLKVTIYPRSSPNTFSTAQASVAQCVNQFDRNWAANPANTNFYLVDLDPVVVDATQASWAIKSGYLNDGAHPSLVGGSAMGYAIAQVINQIVPQQWLFPYYSQADLYDATNNPRGNLLSNGAGQFVGTSGYVSSGCSGTAAANWQLYEGPSTTGLTCVGSLTTLSDGRTCAVVTISGSYTNAGGPTAVYLQSFNGAYGSVNVGDVLQGNAWVNLGANTNILGVNFTLQDTENGSNNYNQAAETGGNTTFVMPSAGWATGTYIPLVTYPLKVKYAPTALGAVLSIWLPTAATSTSASGTVTFCSVALRKVM